YRPYSSGVDAARSRDSAGVPDDLPEMAVEIAEVAGIDPPRPLVRRGDACARGLGLREKLVDLGAAADELAEAELAALRSLDGKLRVLRQVAAPVEAEEQPAFELEQRGRSAGAGPLVRPLAADDAGRLEPEAVAVEGERPLEIVDGQRDHVEARLH